MHESSLGNYLSHAWISQEFNAPTLCCFPRIDQNQHYYVIASRNIVSHLIRNSSPVERVAALVRVSVVSRESVRQSVPVEASRVLVRGVIRERVAIQGRGWWRWRWVPVVGRWVAGGSPRVPSSSRETSGSIQAGDHWVPVNYSGKAARRSDWWKRGSTRVPPGSWSGWVAIVRVTVADRVAIAHGVAVATRVPVHWISVDKRISVVHGMVPVTAATERIPLRSARGWVPVVSW